MLIGCVSVDNLVLTTLAHITTVMPFATFQTWVISPRSGTPSIRCFEHLNYDFVKGYIQGPLRLLYNKIHNCLSFVTVLYLDADPEFERLNGMLLFHYQTTVPTYQGYVDNQNAYCLIVVL